MFTFSTPTFLGIDFGTSHVKAVELTVKNNKPYLVNYGEALMEVYTQASKEIEFKSPEEKVRDALMALLARMKPKSELAYVAMPGFSGLITLIELPKMSKNELENAVRFEAQRYIPSPLEEVVLSWDIVSTSATANTEESVKGARKNDAQGNVEVLLVAALKKEVEKYEQYISQSPVKMEMLELETFSLARALIHDVQGVSLIIDMGSRSTNLILVENGFIKINRNINAGGHEITSTLAEALNITRERAHVIKSGDKDFLNNRESMIVFPSLELVVSEARRMLLAYKEKHKDSMVTTIVLSGGTSHMTGLQEYFSKALGIQASVGNPWWRVMYDEKLSAIIPQLGASYSVALGLALAGVESYEKG